MPVENQDISKSQNALLGKLGLARQPHTGKSGCSITEVHTIIIPRLVDKSGIQSETIIRNPIRYEPEFSILWLSSLGMLLLYRVHRYHLEVLETSLQTQEGTMFLIKRE